MIKATIDYWSLVKLFKEKRDLYNRLLSINESNFISYPRNVIKKNEKDEEVLDGYSAAEFYINDFESVNSDLWKFCTFSPLEHLEMMGGANIRTENVFEAVKRNQIMLPNNLLFEMKELVVETNCCTDIINSYLKEGWKLIAVLPQHQQSRPDYILGKI